MQDNTTDIKEVHLWSGSSRIPVAWRVIMQHPTSSSPKTVMEILTQALLSNKVDEYGNNTHMADTTIQFIL